MTGRRERRYAIDSNLFIRAFRTDADRKPLEVFLALTTAVATRHQQAGTQAIHHGTPATAMTLENANVEVQAR